ncbi:MAG: hypothetical protein U0163_08525 [Gemmatimonadaceae bacterium]
MARTPPTPPTEFSKSDLGDDVLVMNGRHPEVTANSTAQIGNRLTATMMFKPGAKPRALAAVSAHEAFTRTNATPTRRGGQRSKSLHVPVG